MRSGSVPLCDGYHTEAIYLKLGRELPNPLEEPVLKPYHAWLSERGSALTCACAHFVAQLAIAQFCYDNGGGDRSRDRDLRVLDIC